MSQGLAVAIRELKYLPAVWRAPRRSAAATRMHALRDINRLLAHCRAAVPHYRDSADYPDRPLTDLGELAALPLLSKRILLDSGIERFHDPTLRPRQYRVDVTSGTSGARLEVRHDVDGYGYHGATVLRRFLRSGYRPWWRIAHLKPFPRPVRWFQRLGVFRRVVVLAGQSDEDIARQMLTVRPQLIMGYPVVLRTLLRTLSTAELTRLRNHLKLVMTDSELLTDEVAARLTEGFGVPVYDEYSAYEVLTVSTGCRAGSMHIDEDRVWVEIVDDDGAPVPDGTTGSVVVTNFREKAMPLVRYQLGDRARIEPGPCRCGSGFRRMTITEGRADDCVTLSSGRRIYSVVFIALAMFTPGLAECMVRQDAEGDITVQLVPERDASFDQVRAAFAKRFTEMVNTPVPLTFVPAEQVELTPGGKGRFVESAYQPNQAHHS
jgi:phenylacetate-CoA ligase